jgi:hypothetical protein
MRHRESEGAILPGFGAGWNVRPAAGHGIDRGSL